MIPTIESQKTIGLVQLPGMMSGQIIAGADPVQAVQFQLLDHLLIVDDRRSNKRFTRFFIISESVQ